METLLIIILCAAVIAVLPKAPGQTPQPQFVLVQAAPPDEAPAHGPGCLAWALGGLVLLVVLGLIPL